MANTGGGYNWGNNQAYKNLGESGPFLSKTQGWQATDVPKFGEVLGRGVGKWAPLGVAAANVITQAAFYKNLRDQKLKARILPYQETQLSVRPTQGIPAEVTRQMMNNINQIGSSYSGSDPTMDITSKQIAGAQKQKAIDDYSMKEAEVTLQDRTRHDTQTRENEARLIDIRNKNLDRRQQEDEYHAAANLDYTKDKQKLMGTTLDQAQEAIFNDNRYNAKAAMTRTQNEIMFKNWEIGRKTQLMATMDPSDPRYLDLESDIDVLNGELQYLIKSGVPTTGEIRSGWLSGNIPRSKLVPKTPTTLT